MCTMCVCIVYCVYVYYVYYVCVCIVYCVHAHTQIGMHFTCHTNNDLTCTLPELPAEQPGAWHPLALPLPALVLP